MRLLEIPAKRGLFISLLERRRHEEGLEIKEFNYL
jgi:hypothetical protein